MFWVIFRKKYKYIIGICIPPVFNSAKPENGFPTKTGNSFGIDLIPIFIHAPQIIDQFSTHIRCVTYHLEALAGPSTLVSSYNILRFRARIGVILPSLHSVFDSHPDDTLRFFRKIIVKNTFHAISPFEIPNPFNRQGK